MSEVGELRHEIVQEDNTGLPMLHVYLPEGLAFSDVEVTTGSNPDVAEVFIEHICTERIVGLIQLQGYTVPQDHAVVKLNKKHRRYAIRLLPTSTEATTSAKFSAALGSAATIACDSAGASFVEPIFSASSSKPIDSTSALTDPLPLPTAVTGNIFELLDRDDISNDEENGAGGEERAAGGGKKKKKKKKGKKSATTTEVLGEASPLEAVVPNGNYSDGGGVDAAGGGSTGGEKINVAAASGEGSSSAAKKKKEKKGTADTATGTTAMVVATEMGSAETEATEATGFVFPLATIPLEPAARLSESCFTSVPSPSSSAAPGCNFKSPPRAVCLDMLEDFVEKLGSFEVGAAVPHDPLLGPFVHKGLGKVQVKGEDKWLEAPSNSWFVKGLEDAVSPVSAFGVFDGHGGRLAAQHAAKNLLQSVARFAEHATGPEIPHSPERLAAEGYLTTEQSKAASEVAEGDLQRARVAAAQDALIARLPKALHAGFMQCDEEVIARHKSSGTTATVAIQVGWELLVANVGDSLAYLDTGTEIVVISANHRVAESTEEQERIRKAGGRIKPAKYGEDDDPEEAHSGSNTAQEGQQLRVWPGGINMTRTIGDEAAKGLLIAEPAVRQISLPVTGARLIIASDGLWDAVNAKTIIGQLRTCNVREAASKAAVYAMRNKKHDDDVTVVMADFVPRASDTHVPGLLKRTPGSAVATALAALAAMNFKEERAAQSWRPLETPSESWRERHRAHRRRAAAYLQQLDLAEKAEADAAEELERQRLAAVAPAAGTAGAGTANRLPVSDLYREISDIKVDVNEINSMEEECSNVAGDGNWTEVDVKKKKDVGSGYVSSIRELMKVARPGEARQPRLPPGGGEHEERHEAGVRRERPEREGTNRERRPPRRERHGFEASTADANNSAIAAAAAESEPRLALEQQQQPRGERRGDRRDRGRGGRGREGAPGGGRIGESQATVEVAGLVSAPSLSAPSGIVKADGYLFVPKSLLTTGGIAIGAVAAIQGRGVSRASVEGSEPRQERAARGNTQSRKDTGAETPTAEGTADRGVQVSEHAPTDSQKSAAGRGVSSRREQQRRPRRVREEAASAALTAAPVISETKVPKAAPLPVSMAATMGDSVVAPGVGPRHRQRRQQPPGSSASAAQQTQPTKAPRDAAAAEALYSSSEQRDPGGQCAIVRSRIPISSSAAAQSRGQPQRTPMTALQPPATYTGPLDFGAGFGPGSSMWQAPAGGGQYGGFNMGGGVIAPQRPHDLAGGAPQRSSDEVAAAAAAAAAAVLARKAAAGKGGGGGV